MDIKLVRDLVMAAASTDAAATMARAELLGTVPKGAGGHAGHLPHHSDVDWLAGIVLGEGVELPGRVQPLRVAMQHVIESGPARSHAFARRGWTSWLLGQVAEARADLALAADEDPNVELAGQLLQFMDMRQGR